MVIEMRAISAEEFERFFTTTETAFAAEARREDIERHRALLENDRVLVATERDEIVGTTAAFTFSLSIPGGDAPAAGVTMVGVVPSHTRRGILTGLIRQQLEDVHERGEPLAILWASEGAIYQRYGYGLGARHAWIRPDREAVRFRDQHAREGSVKLLSPTEAAKQLDPIYEAARKQIPGMFARSPEWWEKHRLTDFEHEREGGGPLFCALLELEGEARAYALYRVHHAWDEGWPQGRLSVREAISADARATRELWRFIFNIDLVGQVDARVPIDHPLPILLQEPRRLRMTVQDALWVRIVDLVDALQRRAYDVDGSVVLAMSDPLCGWNNGRWRLRVEDGIAEVVPTTDEPELLLEPWDLGSVYLGGHKFADLRAAGRLMGSDPQAIRTADRIFRTDRAPWCPEIF